MSTLKDKIVQLINDISVGLHEREETVSLSLLAILSGQSVFLYGPPGTAKSLVARRLSLAFKESKYFEYLMNRFSTPEEVFGPVSIKELKEDRYIRKSAGYLPEADIAFLDEIWKSSPAILNTLLTIINERKFRNGDKVENVPLKGIIAASNEIPTENQGLEALYDRFIMRLVVNPMTERDNFEALLNDRPTDAVVPVDDALKFNAETWKAALNGVNDVTLSKEVLNIIHSIRVKIDETNKKESDKSKAIYISDRRWQKMAQILKMAAYLCDRSEVKPVDVLVLKNCLWTKVENKESLAKIVENSVREFCVFSSEKFEQWTDEYNNLKREIDDTFFYTSDVYDNTVEIDGEKYFKIEINIPYYTRVIPPGTYYENDSIGHHNMEVFLPKKNFKTGTSFHALDASHNLVGFYKDPKHNFYYAVTTIDFCFNNSASCTMKYTYYTRDTNSSSYKKEEFQTIAIKPSYKAGDCKKVTPKIKQLYFDNVAELIEKYNALEKEVKEFYATLAQENDTPFVTKKDQAIVTAVVADFQKKMRVGKMNAEQLQVKLNQHIDKK